MIKILLILIAVLIVLGYECMEALGHGVSAGRLCYVIALIFLTGYSTYQVFDEHRRERFAEIDTEGNILKKKNFDYKIKKYVEEKSVIFVAEELYVNAKDVQIKPDVKARVYNAQDGLGIEFSKQAFQDIKEFKIKYSA